VLPMERRIEMQDFICLLGHSCLTSDGARHRAPGNPED